MPGIIVFPERARARVRNRFNPSLYIYLLKFCSNLHLFFELAFIHYKSQTKRVCCVSCLNLTMSCAYTQRSVFPFLFFLPMKQELPLSHSLNYCNCKTFYSYIYSMGNLFHPIYGEVGFSLQLKGQAPILF